MMRDTGGERDMIGCDGFNVMNFDSNILLASIYINFWIYFGFVNELWELSINIQIIDSFGIYYEFSPWIKIDMTNQNYIILIIEN